MSLLVVLLVILWFIFSWSVLLMSPKWWLWSAIWWANFWWNEYWSKKTIEWKLKYVALISWILFVIVSFLMPYMS